MNDSVTFCDRYGEMGKSDIALKFYKKSLAIDEEKYGKDHPKVRRHPPLADQVLAKLGSVCLGRNHLQQSGSSI